MNDSIVKLRVNSNKKNSSSLNLITFHKYDIIIHLSLNTSNVKRSRALSLKQDNRINSVTTQLIEKYCMSAAWENIQYIHSLQNLKQQAQMHNVLQPWKLYANAYATAFIWRFILS